MKGETRRESQRVMENSGRAREVERGREVERVSGS